MNTRIWERRGSEAQANDARNGMLAGEHDDIGAALADHFEADLAPLSDAERDVAAKALERGYRHGG
jgi:hypothetical protein